MIYVISTVVVLAVLIFVHELGHFTFAKLFKVHVLKFSLGFGPKILSFKREETEYMLSLLPLGGYVKLLGEDPDEGIEENLKEYSYNTKSALQKSLIIFGGPLFNFIFAAIVFSIIFLKGVPVILPVVGEVQEGMPAISSGIKKGDIVTSINNLEIKIWDDISSIISKSKGQDIEITVKRGKDEFQFSIKPIIKEDKNIFGEKRERYIIGIVADMTKQEIKKVSLFEASAMGLKETYKWIKLTVVSVVKLIQRIIPIDTIGGPIMIGQIAGDQAKEGILNFLFFLGVISVNLGVFNLFPIPILDGGHIVIILLEKLRGKAIDIKKLEIVQKFGLSILLLLMFFAFYNDIIRLVNR